MEKLTQQEEEAMLTIWETGGGFIKDFLEQIPEPKPPYTTLASTVKNLEKKGFLESEKLGNTYRYEPRIKAEDYKKRSGERFHYYTTHGLDSRIKDATRYFLSLRSDSRLTESNQLLHEDDLVVPIINHASFKFGPPPPFDLPPPPPPPVRSEINFVPPLEKR